MPRDVLAEAIDALHTADNVVLTLRLSAPQARALLQRITYLEQDNRVLRQQHAAWHQYALTDMTEEQIDHRLREIEAESAESPLKSFGGNNA